MFLSQSSAGIFAGIEYRRLPAGRNESDFQEGSMKRITLYSILIVMILAWAGRLPSADTTKAVYVCPPCGGESSS
jgi:hypothetical protein